MRKSRRVRFASGFDLRGVPGSGKQMPMGAGGERFTFCGVLTDREPPSDRPDHRWMLTPQGDDVLISRRGSTFVSQLHGLHTGNELLDLFRTTGQGADIVRRMVRAGWFISLPETIAVNEFEKRFGGFTFTRLDCAVDRSEPNAQTVLLRGPTSDAPVAVPGWLYQHMIGKRMRADLPAVVAFGITEAHAWVARAALVLDLLPRLLDEQIATLTPAITSSAARISRDGARSIVSKSIRPEHDEVLSWLIIFLSKV